MKAFVLPRFHAPLAAVSWPAGRRWLLAALMAAVGIFAASCAGRPEHVEHGIASWHGPFLLGGAARTASGERWVNFRMIGAHKRLPFGTIVRVVNLENGRSVKVRIIDRGPYAEGRIIDVSPRAASRLRMREQGLARVRIEVVEWP